MPKLTDESVANHVIISLREFARYLDRYHRLRPDIQHLVDISCERIRTEHRPEEILALADLLLAGDLPVKVRRIIEESK